MRRVGHHIAQLILLAVIASGSPVAGQMSSIGQKAKEKKVEPGPVQPKASQATTSKREITEYQGNPTIEKASLIAVKVNPPKTFKTNDIVTIIVRQKKKYESEGDLESKRDYEISSELDAFIKFFGGGVGSAAFRRGKPNVGYKFGTDLKHEAEATREDSFETRISGKIIDIKPNGNLVLEAQSRIEHDDETAVVTLTGECRSSDVTPDNTVLSTQVADLNVVVKSQGPVKDGSSRGWISGLLDLLRPF